MKYLSYTIVFLIFVLSAISCVERIDIKLEESYTRLVVDGSFTTDTMAHKVVLSKTTSYYYNEPAPAVTGATVQITDGKVSYILTESVPGVYLTDTTVFGVPGETYMLNIELPYQIGGYISYTASSTLFPVNQLDSISLAFHPDWSERGIWEVKCYVQDPLTTDYYRFLVFRNSLIVTDTLDEWFVTDDRLFNGKYAYGAPIGYLDQGSKDEELNYGDTVAVEMNSIGSGYSNFILDAQSEVRGSYPLFSGPPANVKGNVDNGAFGFFAAYSVSRCKTILRDTI